MNELSPQESNEANLDEVSSPWDELSDYADKKLDTDQLEPTEPTDWQEFEGLLDTLGFPEDTHDRADFIEGMVTSGEDIKSLSVAIHEVLVPGVESAENDEPGTIRDREGNVTATLATHEEREEIFDEASKLIKQLGEKRGESTFDDDQAYLDRVANVIGATIVEAHYFKDGNGRLARTLSYLVARGEKDPEWDNSVGGQPGSALRLMTSSKEGQRDGKRNPNRTDKLSDGFSPFGFIPQKNVEALEVIRSTAGIDVPLDEKNAYLEQIKLDRGGMLYGD